MPSTQCVADLMGFKFRLYQGGEKKVPAASPRGRKIAAPKERERTPSSLFRLASLLMRLGYLRLEDVYVHLAPGPSSSTIGVPLFAARTLNPTGQSRVTLSLR